MAGRRTQVKRETDLQLISEWISPGSRVLDVGCGRGILLEHLANSKGVHGLGVDTNSEKVEACVKRGVSVYQGDAEALMSVFDEGHFDWVILSRTVQELDKPVRVIREALRVGRHLAIGFANYGYWLNRGHTLFTGQLPVNEVFPNPWYDDRPHNPVTVGGFEAFCEREGFRISHRTYLRGDWRTPLSVLPGWRAGYAVYALERNGDLKRRTAEAVDPGR